MAAGNDFCNNELKNAVIHLAATDDERGVPAVGKMVFRTDIGAMQLCTSTSPDPTFDGGGTWVNVGGSGGTFGTYTPEILYTPFGGGAAYTDFTTDGGDFYGWYQDLGDVFICGGHITMAGTGPYFPSAVGGESFEISLPFRLYDAHFFGAGTSMLQGTVYYCDNGGTDSKVLMATPGADSSPGWLRGIGFDPASGASISLSYDDVGQFFAAADDLNWLITARKYVP